MANHFSCIGFAVDSLEALDALAQTVEGETQVVPASNGRYLRWCGPCGEELWLRANTKSQYCGMNPHFWGRSNIKVRLEGMFAQPDSDELSASFRAWAGPRDNPEDPGDYPFVFDAPDAYSYAGLRMPALADVQVSAFAHEVTFHADKAAFLASQGERKTHFAPIYFIPSGLFSSDRKGADGEGRAHAMFAGKVVEAEILKNDHSGVSYYWALVETLGGRYDVVIDPEMLDGLPTVGGILEGSYWLSGRIINYPRAASETKVQLPKKKGLLAKFFGM